MNTFVEGEELRLVTMASRLHLLVLVLSATAHAQGPDQQGTYTVLYSRVGQFFPLQVVCGSPRCKMGN